LRALRETKKCFRGFRGLRGLGGLTFKVGSIFHFASLAPLRALRETKKCLGGLCFIWMDSIANWMQNKSIWKIKMNKPDSMEKSRKINLMTLAVGKK